MAWDFDNLAPVDRVLFRSGLVKVGCFECADSHPCFRLTAPLDNDVFAFVRRPVWFRRGGGSYRFVEPGGIVMHRAGSEIYRRSAADQGEHAYWFGVHPDIFVETLERHGLSTGEMGDVLIADPLLRYRLNVLVNRLERFDAAKLAVEEIVLTLLHEICLRRTGWTREHQKSRSGTAQRHQQLVDKVRAYLDEHLTEPLGLAEVACYAGASMYHLCRIFRETTGLTLHAYRIRQRLGRAVEQMVENPVRNLTELAFELGFSSHSHLSRVFNEQIGVPPSRLLTL